MALTSLTNLQPTHVHSIGISTFDGSVSVGGTLTYEDVTNVDAIGIVTARAGVRVTADGSNSANYISVGAGNDLQLFHNGTNSHIRNNTNALVLNADTLYLQSLTENYLTATANGAVELYHNNVKKFETTSTGVSVTGTVAATAFTGDGSALTGITGTTINTNADNRIITGSGTANTLNGEANFTYNGGNNLTLNSTAHDGGFNLLAANNNQETRFRIQGKASDGTGHSFYLNAKRSANRLDIAGGSGANLTIMGSTKNVGVDNTGPESLLHIGSNNQITTAKATVCVAPASGNASMTLRGGSPTIYFDGTSGGNAKLLTDGTDLTISDGTLDSAGNERLRIKSDGKVQFSGATDNIVHTSSNSSRLRLFGGSNESVSNGGVLTLHGVSHSSGNYTDLAAASGGHIQFRSGTNERMRISSEGYVTKPNHPSFCARHQGSDGFDGDIIVLTRISTSWDVWNTGGHYSTTTGKFTAPVDGVYYFEGQLMTTGHSNGDNIQDMLSLMSNNGRISYCRQRKSYFRSDEDANGYYTNSVGGSTRLDSGDTVWIQRHSSQNWSYSNRYYSYFTGWLIG